MIKTTCRWGIMGTAGIAKKNWHAIKLAAEAELLAVASRNIESAQKFISDCQAQYPHTVEPEAVAGYDTLLDRDDIDAVYIPLPTGTRKEWILKAARAGKHVLAEKPCALSADELREILDVCQENNVQFMDGVMFMHSDRLPAMRTIIDDGVTIGSLKRITSHHVFAADDDFFATNIRLNSELEPAGALGDVGWYNLRFVLWAMNWKMPKRVIGHALTTVHREDSPQPVPVEFSAELFYEDVSASLYCSFITQNQQWASIGGTNGFLHVQDFVLPFYGHEAKFDVAQVDFDINNCQFNMNPYVETHKIKEFSNNAVDAQETKLFQKFSAIVLSGTTESMWGEQALKTQILQDACLKSAAQDGKPVEIS